MRDEKNQQYCSIPSQSSGSTPFQELLKSGDLLVFPAHLLNRRPAPIILEPIRSEVLFLLFLLTPLVRRQHREVLVSAALLLVEMIDAARLFLHVAWHVVKLLVTLCIFQHCPGGHVKLFHLVGDLFETITSATFDELTGVVQLVRQRHQVVRVDFVGLAGTCDETLVGITGLNQWNTDWNKN